MFLAWSPILILHVHPPHTFPNSYVVCNIQFTHSPFVSIHPELLDYTPVNETVTFDPVSSNQHLTSIVILGDDLQEGDETFGVELRLISSSVPLDISPSLALIVITEDDEIPDECQTGQLRLGDNATGLAGRVEVCVDGRWTTVCDNGWDYRDAVVVCTQLGLPSSSEHILLLHFFPTLFSSSLFFHSLSIPPLLHSYFSSSISFSLL